jgi:hypothetical protein
MPQNIPGIWNADEIFCISDSFNSFALAAP